MIRFRELTTRPSARKSFAEQGFFASLRFSGLVRHDREDHLPVPSYGDTPLPKNGPAYGSRRSIAKVVDEVCLEAAETVV